MFCTRTSACLIVDFVPSTPIYFHAEKEDDSAPSQNRILHFDRVTHNNGDGYNKDSASFVVPITGTYAFTWSICAGTSTTDHICTSLVKNGVEYGILYTDPYKNYEKRTGFVVAEAEIGDVIFIRTCNGVSISGSVRSDHFLVTSTFSGWLI